jgi:hypothetical protein
LDGSRFPLGGWSTSTVFPRLNGLPDAFALPFEHELTLEGCHCGQCGEHELRGVVRHLRRLSGVPCGRELAARQQANAEAERRAAEEQRELSEEMRGTAEDLRTAR